MDKSAEPKVLNKRTDPIPANAFYGGRAGDWGNPFVMGRHGDRAAVVAKHEAWLRDQHHLLRRLDELKGRDGVCFCAPKACHLDLIVRLANSTREERIAWWRCDPV